VWFTVIFELVTTSGLEFSEGTAAKWIFDVDIEKLRANVLLKRLEDKNRAWLPSVSTNKAFESNISNIIF